MLKRGVLQDRVISLGDFRYVPSITVGESAFPQFSWLIKGYNENTRDKQQRYFNKRLCGVKVTTENAYGILKGKWRILYKKTECHLFNLCYVLMTCIALHNLCNELADPCQPRSKLKVQELALIRKQLHREEDMNESALNRMKISSWLWMDH